ncbi:MAG: hypothetical protein LLG20_01305 [Acidobacteriales bacterium]|nr:hypothetical protein [Terriglobales bacterium]
MGNSFWESIYRYWIWLGVPAMVVGLAALGALIVGVVGLVKRSVLVRVPLAQRQEVQFAESGRVSLMIEGPMLSRRFARIDFELTGIDGDRVIGRRAWIRSRSSGISKARLELLKYDIPRPGRYVLVMNGLGAPRERDAEHAILFTRPHLARTVAYIVGIVLASGVFIASLVFFVLRLLEPGNSS